MLRNNNNKRSCNDRRVEKLKASFPLRTNNNAVILNDRRATCERRMHGLEVSESDISQEVFMNMFKCNHTNTSVDSALDHNIEKGVDVFEGYFNHE